MLRPPLPSGKTRYPLYRRLGGPQGRSGQVREISPPPGFDPRTVQPVASGYTDWAITAHLFQGEIDGKFACTKTTIAYGGMKVHLHSFITSIADDQ
jgi:hypothetical protein